MGTQCRDAPGGRLYPPSALSLPIFEAVLDTNPSMFQSCKHVFPPLAQSRYRDQSHDDLVSIVQARLSAFHPEPLPALTDVKHRGKTPTRGVSTSPLLMQGNTM